MLGEGSVYNELKITKLRIMVEAKSIIIKGILYFEIKFLLS